MNMYFQSDIESEPAAQRNVLPINPDNPPYTTSMAGVRPDTTSTPKPAIGRAALLAKLL